MKAQGQGGELSWFALRVIPQREDMVKKHLIRIGKKAFIKLERRFGKWIKGQRSDRFYCAAPSYVFVGLGDEENPWDFVRTCHLIRSVVSKEGQPAQINPIVLADFLGFDDFNMPEYFRYFRAPAFEIGETVRIDAPSFEGLELPVKDIQRGEAIFELVMFAGAAPAEVRVPLESCYKAA
jgi:transcription antitermination factor NusG